ncbi:M23 family metallopeptidase [Streptomyces sp. XD-27]|uniref:M23 family metallopeptidase n=1 Tax=Streptomyces sp. XD-27 TaxID=3062779 RepID=UPI0026F4640F|nr:M23 family metallopeptidase [Streptomyces sp. XD-27]WKX71817.1 M23 family metallopeptidase [Streptomyces sp. XD-27]
MTKHTTTRTARTSALRTRAAVVAAGLGASVALGAGVALAADADASRTTMLAAASASVADDVRAQADTQARAAAKDAAAKRAAADRAAKQAKDRAAAKKKASRGAPRPAVRSTSDWTSPLHSYVLGSTFGLAGDRWSNSHSGQDFVVPTGTSVKAAHGGVVVKAGPNGGGDGPAYGNAIVIRHGGATYTQYAHLSQVKVHVGQTVGKGQEIGLSGSTGNSTGPHLHFEVRTTPNYGTAVEPLKFLRGHGVGM